MEALNFYNLIDHQMGYLYDEEKNFLIPSDLICFH